jgi:hypothetical protein
MGVMAGYRGRLAGFTSRVRRFIETILNNDADKTMPVVTTAAAAAATTPPGTNLSPYIGRTYLPS